MSGIVQFLKDCKYKLCSRVVKTVVHLVIGNEACDLDSAVSAISLAFLLHQINQKKEYPTDTIYTPLLNIPRKDYRIKTEVKYLFEEIKICEKDLIFREDVNLKALISHDALKISLVDFNTFTNEQEYLNKHVIQILDHHVNKRASTENTEMTIETVGSCTTLISEFVFRHYETIPDETLAYLLYGTILIDTSCLLDKAKTTEKDKYIIGKIEQQYPHFDRELMFNTILNWKHQTTGLTFHELLNKDLKFANLSLNGRKIKIAIAVIQRNIHAFFQEFLGIEIKCKEYLDEVQADGLIMMFVDGQTIFKRFMALYSTDEILNHITNGLQHNNATDLKLERIKVNNSENLICFNQLNVDASRKTILPIIENL